MVVDNHVVEHIARVKRSPSPPGGTFNHVKSDHRMENLLYAGMYHLSTIKDALIVLIDSKAEASRRTQMITNLVA